ncbi:Splicing factor 3B subunit 3 [Araneus ventricosus]|uniref:Splicing factor 3B subunit 3 n=1 Tax=Araneus ventricosus TaxID=182803 RepID=A0A4Y2VJH2_ARAVE|nr:Splicing factor 3B subunit 3 [Araneus ventricosus]
MILYNLTLQRATGITHAVHGNFAGTKQQEIAVSRGKILELLRPDPNTGKVHTLLTVEIFGVIRSMMGFRLTGGSKDYLVIGSDSGKIVILEYNAQKNVFEKNPKVKHKSLANTQRLKAQIIFYTYWDLGIPVCMKWSQVRGLQKCLPQNLCNALVTFTTGLKSQYI